MDKVQTGKFISLVLRHNPRTIGIELDENGWADVAELIAGLNRKGHSIDMAGLEDIVATNNKKRYSFNEDKRMLRANQGHSVDVVVELKAADRYLPLYEAARRTAFQIRSYLYPQ